MKAAAPATTIASAIPVSQRPIRRPLIAAISALFRPGDGGADAATVDDDGDDGAAPSRGFESDGTPANSPARRSAAANDLPSGNRSSGAFASARVRNAASGLGTRSRCSGMSLGGSLTMRYRTEETESPSNGFIPVSIS